MSKEKLVGWAAMDESGFFRTEELILGDDGETALFVPMGEPRMEIDRKFSKEGRRLAIIPVVRCGDEGLDSSVCWYCQEYRMSARAARRYRAVAGGREGRVMVRVTRHGQHGDVKTTYLFTVEQSLSDADAEVCARLYGESQ